MRAALGLFAERGFDQTTAGDIAERAGVTERTFFRHFTDKREVLFDGTHTMERIARDATVEAPPGLAPLDAAMAGVTAGAALLDDRHDHSVRRSMIIASHPSLRERELLKLAALSAGVGEALRERGVPEPAATLAAQSAVTAFQVAFTRWVEQDHPPTIATCIADAAAALRALT